MKQINETTEFVISEALEESPGELSSKNPMVLSCGGIYIPYSRGSVQERKLWHVLNLPDANRPTKVVSAGRLRNPLAEILEKEGMN